MTSEVSLTFASAFTLGLLHSLEPSHAKAILASYFLNRKRTAFEAFAFAFTVTLAHTLVIYLLAIIGYALGWAFTENEAKREVIEHWSEQIGGILMILIGGWMFWNEKKARFHECAEETHDPNHSHGHFFHHHSYHHDHPSPSSLRQIFALGFCSGAIPCMSGLAVLTTAWTNASPWTGFLLLGAFSLGLGLVVLSMCLLMLQMPQMMDYFWKNSIMGTG